jgi:hypothetical protein
VKLFSAITLACCLLSGCGPRAVTPKPEELVGTWVAPDGGTIHITDKYEFSATGIPERIVSHRSYSGEKRSCEGQWEISRLSEGTVPQLLLRVESRDDGEGKSMFTLGIRKTTWDWRLVGYLTSIDVGDAYAFERKGGQ